MSPIHGWSCCSPGEPLPSHGDGGGNGNGPHPFEPLWTILRTVPGLSYPIPPLPSLSRGPIRFQDQPTFRQSRASVRRVPRGGPQSDQSGARNNCVPLGTSTASVGHLLDVLRSALSRARSDRLVTVHQERSCTSSWSNNRLQDSSQAQEQAQPRCVTCRTRPSREHAWRSARRPLHEARERSDGRSRGKEETGLGRDGKGSAHVRLREEKKGLSHARLENDQARVRNHVRVLCQGTSVGNAKQRKPWLTCRPVGIS